MDTYRGLTRGKKTPSHQGYIKGTAYERKKRGLRRDQGGGRGGKQKSEGAKVQSSIMGRPDRGETAKKDQAGPQEQRVEGRRSGVGRLSAGQKRGRRKNVSQKPTGITQHEVHDEQVSINIKCPG